MSESRGKKGAQVYKKPNPARLLGRFLDSSIGLEGSLEPRQSLVLALLGERPGSRKICLMPIFLVIAQSQISLMRLTRHYADTSISQSRVTFYIGLSMMIYHYRFYLVI
ncbi:hypothetical protein ACTXT7_008731 [Hymenolepis weldensis]